MIVTIIAGSAGISMLSLMAYGIYCDYLRLQKIKRENIAREKLIKELESRLQRNLELLNYCEYLFYIGNESDARLLIEDVEKGQKKIDELVNDLYSDARSLLYRR